jgi:hypothetical protein
VVDHGHITGHQVEMNFTSGSATDGFFTVTSVADDDTFTIEHGASGATSGNVTLERVTISDGNNVANVAHLRTGEYFLNFETPFVTANYAISGAMEALNSYGGTRVVEINEDNPPTEY